MGVPMAAYFADAIAIEIAGGCSVRFDLVTIFTRSIAVGFHEGKSNRALGIGIELGVAVVDELDRLFGPRGQGRQANQRR